VDAYASEEDDSREDILLLTIGESYRPSPANPSPVPESEEEDELPIVPRTLGEEETAPVPAEHHPVLAPSELAGFPATLQPPLPAWSNGSSISLSPEAPPAAPLVSEPSPPAVPLPAAKVSLKGVAGTRGMRRSEVGVHRGSRVDLQCSLDPFHSPSLRSPPARLPACFPGANPPSVPPLPPPLPSPLICCVHHSVQLRYKGQIRWRCYLFDFLFRCSLFWITTYNISACVSSNACLLCLRTNSV
jgi:hypothetical protein